MSLPRLKRQDFHTCICGVCLILLIFSLLYYRNRSMRFAVLVTALYAAGGGIAGIFETAVRRNRDLLLRQLFPCLIAAAAGSAGRRDASDLLFTFLLCSITYGIWLVLAKKWLQHELGPGWTLLLYDSRENLERAKAAAESRKDLMMASFRFEFGSAAAREKELDDLIRLFRIPQMLICLESGSEEAVAYCKRTGITAFVLGKTGQKGRRIDRDGLFYIRPGSGAFWKK